MVGAEERNVNSPGIARAHRAVAGHDSARTGSLAPWPVLQLAGMYRGDMPAGLLHEGGIFVDR